MATFGDFLTVSASTQRPAADGSGLAANLAAVSIMPLMPLDAAVVERLDIRSARESKVTYCNTADIIEGDRLVVAGVAYIVQAVAEWPWDRDGGNEFLELVVHEQK